jgi:hypothetical protein
MMDRLIIIIHEYKLPEIMRITLSILLITSLYSYGQDSDWRGMADGSDLINLNFKPFKFVDWSPLTVEVDTINMCRIRTTKIRKLTLVRSNKSVLTVSYNSFGDIIDMNPGIGWLRHSYRFDTVSLNCYKVDSLYWLRFMIRAGKTEVHRWKDQRRLKGIYKYDSLGYLVSSTIKVRGLIKWDNSGTRPTFNSRTIYKYSDNHLTIEISEYKNNWANFKKAELWEKRRYTFYPNHNVKSDCYLSTEDNEYHCDNYSYDYYE